MAECADDIGDSGDKKDSMYLTIMDMTFISESVAYDFYNNYAKEQGFSIRLSKTKKTKDVVKEVRRRRMVCSRQGKRDSKRLTMENHT
jgi:hypothetical protein